ncbi:MAG: GlyGly-CTERM sorting domain-containing protein [Desulfatiglans sp.]|nr:GlyGly-CTERM sorting domain-containing protein [Desulfatiglans sp.]
MSLFSLLILALFYYLRKR